MKRFKWFTISRKGKNIKMNLRETKKQLVPNKSSTINLNASTKLHKVKHW